MISTPQEFVSASKPKSKKLKINSKNVKFTIVPPSASEQSGSPKIQIKSLNKESARWFDVPFGEADKKTSVTSTKNSQYLANEQASWNEKIKTEQEKYMEKTNLA